MEEEPDTTPSKNKNNTFGSPRKTINKGPMKGIKLFIREFGKWISDHEDDNFVKFGIGDKQKDWTGEKFLKVSSGKKGKTLKAKMQSSDGKIQVATNPQNSYNGKVRAEWDISWSADIKTRGKGSSVSSSISVSFSLGVLSGSINGTFSSPSQAVTQTILGVQFEDNGPVVDKFKEAYGDDDFLDNPVFSSPFVEKDTDNGNLSIDYSTGKTKEMKGGEIDLELRVFVGAQAKDSDGGSYADNQTSVGSILIENRDFEIR